MPSKFDRRTVVKSLAAATTAPFWPGCTPEEAAVNPATVREAITHVVVVMMENRTFDNYLGALSLVEGRTDVDGLTADMSNFDADGNEYLVHLADEPCVEDPPHSWGTSRSQFNGGANDGFVTTHVDRHGLEHARIPMQYWTRKSLPISYAFSDHYVTCDRWFGSQLSSTWPNRFYSHCAQNMGTQGNSLPEGGSYDPMPTIYESLSAKGVSWGCYHLTAPLMLLLPGHFDQDHFFPFEEFDRDAQRGRLPQVTVVEPYYGRADDHPPAHPVAGQLFLSSVYQSLARSPHWGSTVVFLTYDEHGGFFDHVAPPELPDDYADLGFGQAGFRVPAHVIGPYAKEMAVSSTVYDHTSMLRFIEDLFDLDPLTARDAAANNLMDALDMERVEALNPRAPVELPVIEANEEEIFADECVLGLGGRDLQDDHGLLRQPEFEAWLDGLHMQHPLDNREFYDADYEAFVELTRAQGVWKPA